MAIAGRPDGRRAGSAVVPGPTARCGDDNPKPDWTHVHNELRRPGVTLSLLWKEYREAHPRGYGYSRFCEPYRRWER